MLFWQRGRVRPQSLLYYRGLCIPPVAISAIAVGCVRTGVMFACVYTLSLLLSPWTVFAPGSCSPVCTPCHYCYRRGFVRTGVMFTSVCNLSLLLSPWVMFAAGSCSPVFTVIACHCRGRKPCCCCCSTLCQCLVPPHGLYPSRRTGTVVDYVRTFPLLSLVVVGIGPCCGAVPSDALYLWYGGVTRRILRILLQWVLCVVINNQWAGVLIPYVGLRYRR